MNTMKITIEYNTVSESSGFALSKYIRDALGGKIITMDMGHEVFSLDENPFKDPDFNELLAEFAADYMTEFSVK